MKKLDAIKIYYFNSIYENKSLTSKEKLNKIKQIKESKTYNQIEKVISEIPVISIDPQVQEVSSGMLLAVIILQHSYQKYVNLYKRLMVPCDEAPNQYKCKNKARLQAKETQLRALLDHRGKCRTRGDINQQKTCQDKVDEKIKLVKMDVTQIRAKITS
jgi:hypothetical protein